ncbi:MAG TPA: polysaccharide biosynthesis/export family protein [Acidobacteriota bacterium]|nr:polysaccharide biosynthesis/export family protein [Acidobacteriota bacterium]
MKRLAILSAILILGSSPLAFSQVEGVNPPQAETPNRTQTEEWNQKINSMSSLFSGSGEYRLGPGDLIEISVFGVDRFNHTLRVNSSGLVKVPLAGVIEVGGLTPAEVEVRVADILREDLIKDPQVSVFVREYRSQPVYIIGAVNKPGQYQITQQIHLIDVISMAGGLADSASHEATLQRKVPVEPGSNTPPETVRIDLEKLLVEGDLSLNVPVQGGDVINIPERVVDVFYVVGEVGRPGAFQLPEEQDLLISQALAQAGGPVKTAKADKGILVRYDEEGRRQELAVDFKDILEGKKPDFRVMPNDVIFIPGSTFKDIGYGLLGVIPQTFARVPYVVTR